MIRIALLDDEKDQREVTAALLERLPPDKREALLGAKDFVSLQASGLDATRRSLAGR